MEPGASSLRESARAPCISTPAMEPGRKEWAGGPHQRFPRLGDVSGFFGDPQNDAGLDSGSIVRPTKLPWPPPLAENRYSV